MLRLLIVATAFAWIGFASPAFAVDGGRYGDVRLAVPNGTPRGYVVLFSDAGGWTSDDQARLDAIAGLGAIAVGVDTDAYLARVASSDTRCAQFIGDTEGFSRQVQREHAGAEYFYPIVAGVGKGGALAGAIIAQAPNRTLGGAVSIDPWSVLEVAHGWCPRVVSGGEAQAPRTFRVPILKQFWTVALSPSASYATRAHFDTLTTLVPPLKVDTLEAVPGPQTIASLIAPHLIQDDFAKIDELPLVELPASSPSCLMAVFFSGDGGWRDIDKTIGENLQSLGVSVVGWDSVRYFWTKKTPEQTALDLSSVLLAYTAKWHADRVALIGFSFGADIIPSVYNRLRQSLKDRVPMLSLLSPEPAADWEIRVIGWLGAPPSARATPLGPAIEKIPGKLIQWHRHVWTPLADQGLFSALR